MLIIEKNVSKKRILCVILYIFVLFSILLIKNQYSSLLLKHSNYGMEALISKGKIDYLFVGSSTFRQGLDIEVLEKELDNDSYILTYNGNQPCTEYIEIKKLIENDVSINNLFIDMYPITLCREPGLDDEKLLMELSIKEKCELYDLLSSKTPDVFWRTFISSNNEQIITWPVNKYLVDTQFKKGGTLVHNNGMSEEAYNSLPLYDFNGTINSVQLDSLIGIIDLCHSNGINLIFVETPKTDSIVMSAGYNDIMEQYERFLNEKNVSVVRYTGDGMQYSDFADEIHLSFEGRVKFTKKLIESYAME